MPYKDNCKVEGEVITRLKIARHYFADNITQTEIAKDIGCHKNTINEIIKLCHAEDNPEILKLLSGHGKIKTLDLKLFEFLKFKSRRPKTNCRAADENTEKTILEKHADKKWGFKRLYKHLKRAGMNMETFSLGKIKGVYKREGLKAGRIRTMNGQRRALYNYAEIGAFEQLQYDTKEISDQHALPPDIYRKFQSLKLNLPKYQWTIVDAKTKTRFLAWSYTLTSFYGLKFLQIVILWLRAHGISGNITTRMDGGAEFFSASERKLEDWNLDLVKLNAIAEWTGGAKWKNNLVERTHRTDDEEFYCPRGQLINSKTEFLIEGQYWNFYYNNRSSDGIGMDGMSPKEKLCDLGIYNADRICRFPILILDELFTPLLETFPQEQSQNVLTHYPYVLTREKTVMFPGDYRSGLSLVIKGYLLHAIKKAGRSQRVLFCELDADCASRWP